MARTLIVTLTALLDENDFWGWDEIVDECDELGEPIESRDRQLKELMQEDMSALLDDCRWHFEIK